MKRFNLNDGNEIPALGFGTWQMTGEECTSAVLSALEVGYRHIDTADRYENHFDIAKALRQANINREELFITSKVWFTDLGHDELIDTCKRSLEELQISYLDLFLIHWPNREISIKESLEAFEELKQNGLIKSFGVSNCTKHHLQDCIDSGFTPANNQVELHPLMGQPELQKFCDENKIVLTAYSPLGHGEEINLPEIVEIAQKHGKSPAQVIINWITARGIVAIPKSTNPGRIKENFESLDFELTAEEIKNLNALDKNSRQISPDWADFEY